ncbi:hypothetical protein [Brevibacterium ravenspurgense]|uniref:hypothetical protein n=1 Tax=Brevibacterium ravenspurgense TaxID=479117 RepID=UPI00082515B9
MDGHYDLSFIVIRHDCHGILAFTLGRFNFHGRETVLAHVVGRGLHVDPPNIEREIKGVEEEFTGHERAELHCPLVNIHSGVRAPIAFGNIPTGPLIVLTPFAIFVVSLLFSPRRSIITRVFSRRRARAMLKHELLMERTVQ